MCHCGLSKIKDVERKSQIVVQQIGQIDKLQNTGLKITIEGSLNDFL